MRGAVPLAQGVRLGRDGSRSAMVGSLELALLKKLAPHRNWHRTGIGVARPARRHDATSVSREPTAWQRWATSTSVSNRGPIHWKESASRSGR